MNLYPTQPVMGYEKYCLAASIIHHVSLIEKHVCHCFEFWIDASHILLQSVEKRMPASTLLSSPWFQLHEINDVDDASLLMKLYMDRAYPPL